MDLDANEIKELDAFHKMNTKDQEKEIQELVLAAGEISHPQTNQNDQLGTG